MWISEGIKPELGMTAQTLRGGGAGFWQLVDKIRIFPRRLTKEKKAARVNRDGSLDVKAWLRNCWRFWEGPGRVFCVLPFISKHLLTRTHSRAASVKKRAPFALRERSPLTTRLRRNQPLLSV